MSKRQDRKKTEDDQATKTDQPESQTQQQSQEDAQENGDRGEDTSENTEPPSHSRGVDLTARCKAPTIGVATVGMRQQAAKFVEDHSPGDQYLLSPEADDMQTVQRWRDGLAESACYIAALLRSEAKKLRIRLPNKNPNASTPTRSRR